MSSEQNAPCDLGRVRDRSSFTVRPQPDLVGFRRARIRKRGNRFGSAQKKTRPTRPSLCRARSYCRFGGLDRRGHRFAEPMADSYGFLEVIWFCDRVWVVCVPGLPSFPGSPTRWPRSCLLPMSLLMCRSRSPLRSDGVRITAGESCSKAWASRWSSRSIRRPRTRRIDRRRHAQHVRGDHRPCSRLAVSATWRCESSRTLSHARSLRR